MKIYNYLNVPEAKFKSIEQEIDFKCKLAKENNDCDHVKSCLSCIYNTAYPENVKSYKDAKENKFIN